MTLHYRKDPPEPSDFKTKALAATIAAMLICIAISTLYLLYWGCSQSAQWLFDLL